MLGPIVQLSLDLTSIEEALHVAAIGVRAGVDWLEAGTPLHPGRGLARGAGLAPPPSPPIPSWPT